MPAGNTFLFASPGRGKTLLMAMMARDGLRYGRRKQFSNFPVVTPEGKTTFVWSRDMILHGIRDADIYWDEAQMDYDSAVVKTLPPEDDDFFATSGQCGNSIYIASQGLTRVTKGIRDRMNYFTQVDVVLELPGLRNARGGWFRPVLFRKTTWQNWEDIGKKDRVFTSSLFFFNMQAAMSYDTTWFAGQRRDPPEPRTWEQEFDSREGDHERFTQNLNAIRQAGLRAAAKRFIVSQIRPKIVCNPYISKMRQRLEPCANRIRYLVTKFKTVLPARIFQNRNKRG